MSEGSLMQLVAKGAQDVYLTKDKGSSLFVPYLIRTFIESLTSSRLAIPVESITGKLVFATAFK
jgi:hypothetical protein